ncbi:MAG: TonB-dependent receptor [Gemmatimonadota bacterium]
MTSRLSWLVAARRLWLAIFLALFGQSLAAQGMGSVAGTVTRADDGSPLASVLIAVQGTSITAVTNTKGRYLIDRVPAGGHTLVFRWLGYKPAEATVTVTAGSQATADAKLETLPFTISDLIVTGASRVPERAVEAPAAVSVVEPRILAATSITGQAPLALAQVPGVDIPQNGVFDFNVNARGFNSSLNRRVLVLIDGRDPSTAFLGSQEWNALPIPVEDMAKMELVRGPGSALYGANAFSGVLNIRTFAAREVVGTKLTLGGGQLSTFKGDLRHAGLWVDGRVGYRVNFGYYRSDTWSRSRTLRDLTSLQKEYAPVTETPVPLGREVRPLNGQTADPLTGVVSGDRDPVKSIYGSARVDYYADNGSVVTGEYGAAQGENETAVTGIGRVQITKAFRPYARLAWQSNKFNVMAYWNSRETREPQYSLASGGGLYEKSSMLHLEAQQNAAFASDKGHFVFGSSIRNYRVDTRHTLMGPADDDRSDYYYSLFAQTEYQIAPKVKVVGAARYDLGSLIDGQLSPKLALVISPNDKHSFRFTFNRAFQNPNYSEFFLNVAAGAPADLRALEAGLRASPLGPALAGVPVGALFDNSQTVPVRARGNAKLDVEKVTGYEFGYRGDLTRKLYVTFDAYRDVLKNFVTDLLPGVNPAFPYWTAPAAVPAAARAALQSAVRNALVANPASRTAGLGLSRTEDGKTAIVVSYANAGQVTQYGFEAGVGLQLTNTLRADGSFSLFHYAVNNQQEGDKLLANTPSAKGHVALSYSGRTGLDLGISLRAVKGFDWAAGVFAGYIEPQETIDVNGAYDINNSFKMFATAVNILDQQRYTIFGGSVNGRRILAGVTTRF